MIRVNLKTGVNWWHRGASVYTIAANDYAVCVRRFRFCFSERLEAIARVLGVLYGKKPKSRREWAHRALMANARGTQRLEHRAWKAGRLAREAKT